ncbi:MAG: efflux RND transporter periplasmic adaptor subunit [Gammaproteobacteria bacterium]|nr:efflux RND transporter periplasmic adaptor subunit [Gammaproteobacteria bacterium]
MFKIQTNRFIGIGQSARSLLVALLLGAALLFVSVEVSVAHEGDEPEEVGDLDMDAPRVITPETSKHIGLKTAEVDVQLIEEVIELSGIVKAQPSRRYSVFSLLDGKATQVHVQVGDQVKTGQILIEIESLPYLERWSNLQILQARIKALEQERKAAEVKLEQAQGLAGKTIPVSEITLRQADLAKVIASINLARIEARQTKAWLRAVSSSPHLIQSPENRFVLRAETDGVVVQRHVTSGQWVQEGQTLIEIADYSVVLIEGQLPESLIARVRARQTDKVRIRTPSDLSFIGEGKIRYISPDLNPTNRTARLIIDAPNPNGVLRSEMWVDLVIIQREVKEALVIPRTAMVVQGPLHFVFVQNGDQYEKQDITPGVTDDRYVEVKDGLFPGDVIVTEGAYSLTHLKPKGSSTSTPTGNMSDGHSHQH